MSSSCYLGVLFSYAVVPVLLGLFLTCDGFYRTLLAGDCILWILQIFYGYWTRTVIFKIWWYRLSSLDLCFLRKWERRILIIYQVRCHNYVSPTDRSQKEIQIPCIVSPLSDMSLNNMLCCATQMAARPRDVSLCSVPHCKKKVSYFSSPASLPPLQVASFVVLAIPF
jgi:hypothetical protein